MKKTVASLFAALALSLSFAGAPAFAAEPTMHEIYQAANAGRMDDAQRMMREVLQAHPNSAKAHYVDAELLAKQGKLAEARGELAAAEKLAPGLPFASAQSVTELRNKLDNPAPTVRQSHNVSRADTAPASSQAAAGSGFPMGMVFAGVLLIGFIVWAVRFMARRAGPPAGGYGGYQPAYPGAPSGPYNGPAGYQYGPAPGYGPAPQAPGMGGQILGGLATGAAIGAGMAAGSELIRHMSHRDDNQAGTNHLSSGGDSNYVPFQSIPDSAGYDMGGNDFGVSDGGWDDNSSGGGGDWN